MLTQKAVVDLILGERAYQDAKWGPLTNHRHEVGAWITLIDKFVHDAKQAWTSNAGDASALVELRKVAALAFACLEEHGAPARGQNLEDW